MNDISGKVWLFNDDVDTDLIVPGRFLDAAVEEIAGHVLEGIRPDFAANVSAGDIIVAGKNFGCGSSRENAASALFKLGIACVVAESFGRIFFRNGIAIGMPLFICRGARDIFSEGDIARISLNQSAVFNLSRNTAANGEGLSGEVIKILEAGGILEYLRNRKGDLL
jgi:3-isopropylmalate/(R)-2-methylmalate dehydratase small subunit